jgi:hypothetical protein
VRRIKIRQKALFNPPHPNLLPEGEGTVHPYLNGSDAERENDKRRYFGRDSRQASASLIAWFSIANHDIRIPAAIRLERIGIHSKGSGQDSPE